MTDAAQDIRNLVYAVAFAFDAGDFDEVGRIFENADYCHRLGDGPIRIRLRGRDLAAYLRGRVLLYPDGTPRTRHLVSNPTLAIDEAAGTATSVSYLTTLQQVPGGGLEVIAVAAYHDRFTRGQEGWRFAERVIRAPTSDGVHRDFMGDMTRHTRVDR